MWLMMIYTYTQAISTFFWNRNCTVLIDYQADNNGQSFFCLFLFILLDHYHHHDHHPPSYFFFDYNHDYSIHLFFDEWKKRDWKLEKKIFVLWLNDDDDDQWMMMMITIDVMTKSSVENQVFVFFLFRFEFD